MRISLALLPHAASAKIATMMLRSRRSMARARNSTTARPRAGTKRTAQAAAVAAGLAKLYPDATSELDHENAYQLLVATILAAQSTDKLINTVTPKLFARYPDARALAAADPAELEQLVYATGFFRSKARNLMGMARALVERHGGEVPRSMVELVELPGVARKTANVVLGTVFGINEGVIVDTHVTRLAQRLGLSDETDPVKIEQDLMAELPREQWTDFAHGMTLHGRRVCFARKPDCEHCALAPICPSAFTFDTPAPKRPKAATKPKPKPKRAAPAAKKKRARR